MDTNNAMVSATVDKIKRHLEVVGDDVDSLGMVIAAADSPLAEMQVNLRELLSLVHSSADIIQSIALKRMG